MKRKIVCFLMMLFCSLMLAQETVKHTVAEGETIAKIAQKYKITPFDIYKLNPDAQSGVKPSMVLIIPRSTAPKETPAATKPVVVKPAQTKPVVKSAVQQIHTVKAKESLYGISKMYEITIEELEKNNPILKENGLQPGQVLVIHNGTQPKTKFVVAGTTTISHEVKPKETKYGIATKYGITVAELERQNPEVVANLPIGYVLKINKNGKSAPTIITSITTQEPSQPKEVKPTPSKPLFDYTVKDGDTFYSLSKTIGLSQDEMTKLNPALSEGLKEGMVLKVPMDLSVMASPSKSTANLSNSISKKDKKQLVLLIPFNVSKIETDTLKTLNSK